MDADPPVSESPLKDKADALHALISGPLAVAAVKASGRARSIPAGKDFHFYYNFDEFKAPVKEIKEKAESSLRSIAASEGLWGSKNPPQFPEDLDDAYDWLVSINDELVDRLAVSMDEFKSLREKEEEAGGNAAAMELEGGFQLVYGKKKKKGGPEKYEGLSGSSSSTVVNMAMKDKRTTAARSKVPFHIPTIPRPQDEYSIIVNNQNQPFEHVWLETSADGSRFIHPLEKLSGTNLVDRNCEGEPVQPPPLEATPFKLVEVVNDLKMVAAKLRGVNEFAVDLEHNQYRSFQGLTCLMQISTRTEDFVIDTLKLRIHIGPHLREVFKNPSKRKIMHGADRDIIWLQRDFGIYVCNLFDTGQASRVLQLERNSLEYLLSQFCGVNANKEYQTADWRLRPLPEEMIKYAREDTHYLLYIYDQMKRMLLAKSSSENDLLLEVHKRSSEICMQLYEKELLTDTSYLNIYGLSYADFNSKQLAIAAGLFQWRDTIARAEDESTGYILPNKTLLEIAREMPLTSGKLRRLVRSKHPFVERHLNSVIGIIKSSIANSYLFEGMAEQLKERLMEANVKEDSCNSESPANDDLMDSTNIEHISDRSTAIASVETVKTVGQIATDSLEQPYAQIPNLRSKNSPATGVEQENNFMPSSGIGFSVMQSYITEKDDKETMKNNSTEFLQPRKSGGASVQQLKKPTCAFGALFCNTSSRRKPTADKVGLLEQDKNVNKVEQIQSTVALPFYHFSGVKPSELQVKENAEPQAADILQQHPTDLTKLEDVIPLDRESEESSSNSAMEDDRTNSRECPDRPEIGVGGGGGDCQPERNTSDEPMSPSELSSSFEKCFQSLNERMASQQKQKQKPSQEPTVCFNLKPFDYSAARKNLMLGKIGEDETETEANNKTSLGSKKKPKDSVYGKDLFDEQSRGSQQPRRRQAFPPSGNRSTTYH